MQIAYDWLKDYLTQELGVNELSEILTSIGLEVEGIQELEQIQGSLKGVVVGHVKTVEQHPNADRLKLTTVDIGNEVLQIVCGASNVAIGQKVLVATVGATIYPKNGEPITIKAAKIRGEKSFGMICAEDELGLGNSHDGIMVLSDQAIPGTPAGEFLNILPPQKIFSIGLTPNRSDAMSHYGVARDVNAYLAYHKNASPQKQDDAISLPESKNNLPIKVIIEDNEKCRRYAGVVIDNVTVKASPAWLQHRLLAIGINPKNNIVDITNYVLHDIGQPLHCFDYDQIADAQIQIRVAQPNEPFRTLEDKSIKLHHEDLVIADAHKPMCIAGVMGGLQSGVNEQTKRIFLESAWFHPISIRRTSLRHQIRSDAALRFEKTANMDMVLPALMKAANMIIQLAGGEVASHIIDEYPITLTKRNITVKYGYIDKICGKHYDKERIDTLLTYLGFEILQKDEDEIQISVPHQKTDVIQSADIAEEVLRIDGINNVPINNQVQYTLTENKYPNNRVLKEKISNWLSNNGLQEIVTNSIIDAKFHPGNDTIVKMLNSLTNELNALRPQLLESGLEVLSYNINRKSQNLALYEMGNIYWQESTGRYFQQEKLGIWITGKRIIDQWQEKSREYDVFYLKGIVESIFRICGLPQWHTSEQDQMILYYIKDDTIGQIQEIPTNVLNKNNIKQSAFYAELDINLLSKYAGHKSITYRPVNKFPSVERDLALVLDRNILYSDIESVTQSLKLPALKKFSLFDIYEGDKIEKNLRSWAIKYTFQLEDKTLTDKNVEEMMQKLIKKYEQQLKAIIRI